MIQQSGARSSLREQPRRVDVMARLRRAQHGSLPSCATWVPSQLRAVLVARRLPLRPPPLRGASPLAIQVEDQPRRRWWWRRRPGRSSGARATARPWQCQQGRPRAKLDRQSPHDASAMASLEHRRWPFGSRTDHDDAGDGRGGWGAAPRRRERRTALPWSLLEWWTVQVERTVQ